MKLPGNIGAALRAAAAYSMPFAAWRRPGGKDFEAVISCGATARRAVFAAGTSQPFFALNRFDSPDANISDAIVADIVVEGSVLRYRNGETYASEPIDDAQHRIARAAAESAAARAPLRAGAGAERPKQTGEVAYRGLVARATAAIGDGAFRKVVTSRAEARPLAADHDLLALLETLAAKLPKAFVALVHLPGEGAWLVGTPESLLSVRDNRVSTVALAGTQWAKEDTAAGDVCWPDKIIEEQALVGSYIRGAFEAGGIHEFDERGPRTVRAANLVHLRSEFEADLARNPHAALDTLLRKLHPTSAVLGMPKKPAYDFLLENEGYERGYYTGFLGPVGLDGATDLYVNLRTAQIIGDTAYLYVGGGIVGDSRPEVEWEETVQKTRTVGSIL